MRDTYELLEPLEYRVHDDDEGEEKVDEKKSFHDGHQQTRHSCQDVGRHFSSQYTVAHTGHRQVQPQ